MANVLQQVQLHASLLLMVLEAKRSGLLSRVAVEKTVLPRADQSTLTSANLPSPSKEQVSAYIEVRMNVPISDQDWLYRCQTLLERGRSTISPARGQGEEAYVLVLSHAADTLVAYIKLQPMPVC